MKGVKSRTRIVTVTISGRIYLELEDNYKFHFSTFFRQSKAWKFRSSDDPHYLGRNYL